MRLPGKALSCAVAMVAILRCVWAQPAPAEARAIAEKAYTFAYPLILMELTRRNAMQYQVQGAADVNRLPCVAISGRYLSPGDSTERGHSIFVRVAGSFEGAGSASRAGYAWPLLPDAVDGRWTETVSVPGKRTTGTGEGWFAIAGPGWKGTLPPQVQRIDCPTNMAWLLGRTQTNGVADYPAVHAIQNGFVLMPLSRYPDGPVRITPTSRVAI